MVKIVNGGDVIELRVNLFFIFLIIYFSICFYSIYLFINVFIFHNIQGSKLNIKKNSL